jgi:hypothetical protein
MQREQLRTVVRGAYDIQKLRIQMGNRIVGNFKAKLGQKPGEKEEEIEEDAKAVLADLRMRYKKLTDGVTTFPRQATFKGDEVISTYTELCLLAQYVGLEKAETDHFSRLGRILTEFAIWNEFLLKVKGVGPAMAGVIVSEFDIHKARYPSSMWAYAGLDCVTYWTLVETFTEDVTVPRAFIGPPPNAKMSEHGNGFLLIVDDLSVARYQAASSGRSKKKEHLREVEYKDKDGKPATRMGITFNPFLKTKLVGVLGASFLRAGDSPYAKVYYDYKHRMESHTKYGIHNDKKKDEDGHIVTSKLRRHNMAIRYMIKMFLIDLYKAWREIEGLEVAPPYSEAKLGKVHVA